jgi:hypothetical protein
MLARCEIDKLLTSPDWRLKIGDQTEVLMKKLVLTLAFALMGTAAHAQEVGVLGGFAMTTADSRADGVSYGGKVNFRLGVPVAFELVDKLKFRTGLIYTQRHIEIKEGGMTGTAEFEYFDIPVLVQYKIHEMFGIFGGLTMAINSKKSAEIGGVSGDATGTESILPLVTVGVTTLFNDMIGFDFYYERGIGNIADDAKDFSTFGANFIYWIY